MKIYSKEGKELKMGDWVVETVEKRTPTSKIVQTTKMLLTPESIMDLIDAGMITLKEEKAENTSLTLDNVYTHITDKTGMPESEVVALLNNVHSIYPIAAVNIVLRALAEMLDDNYEDHISESEEIYSVTPLNGKIIPIDKSIIKNYKNFAAFRNMEDAKTACRVLKKLFKEMYK